MGSQRLHSIPMRWRCVPKQSCPTHKRNSATAFLLGQSGVLAISRLHGFWDSFFSSSCMYALWNTCFRWSLMEWYDVSLVCVCKLFPPFLASASACSFPAILQCPGIQCSAICLCLTLSCIRAWQSLASADITVSVDPADSSAAFESQKITALSNLSWCKFSKSKTVHTTPGRCMWGVEV
jgi:hypothetical protein